MDKSEPDDIGRLLGQIDLDRKAYKIFRGGGVRPLQSLQDAPRSEAQSSDICPQVPERENTAATGLQHLDARLVQEQDSGSAGQPWAALDSLFGSPHSSGSPGSHPPNARMPIPASSFLAVAGGVGVSTISTALARLSSLAGQRVLLLDTQSPTLLPWFFGSRPPRTALSTFVSSNNPNGGVVHIGSRHDRAPESWLWDHVESLASDIDQIFLDGAEEPTWESIGSFTRETVRVLVLIPDIRCLVHLQRLEDTHFGGSTGKGSESQPFLLLNQFDAADPLHLQIRDRLEDQLKGRLIPFSIPREPLFQSALCAGKTIIDYAPRSAATNHLRLLHDWLRHEWICRSASELRKTVKYL